MPPLDPSFFEAVATNSDPSITSIRVWDEKIDALQMMKLLSALHTNHTVYDLDLRNNGIDVSGVLMLVDFLQQTRTLASLSLLANNVRSDGAAALAKALSAEGTTVSSLNLSGNNIGDKGAIALALMLRVNSTLAILELLQNGIGSNGWDAICKALESNYTVTTLNYEGNELESHTKSLIDGYLQRNQRRATDLLAAASRGDLTAVEKMLNAKTSPCSKYARGGAQTNGPTALHMAVRRNDLVLARLLLSVPGGKALLHFCDQNGYTPTMLAKEMRYMTFHASLNQYLPDSKNPFKTYTTPSLEPSSSDRDPEVFFKKCAEELGRDLSQIKNELETLKARPRKTSGDSKKIKNLELLIEDLQIHQARIKEQLAAIEDLQKSKKIFSQYQKAVEQNLNACSFYKWILLFINSVYTGDLAINSGNINAAHSVGSSVAKGFITGARIISDIVASPLVGWFVGGAGAALTAGINHVDDNLNNKRVFLHIENHPDPRVTYKRHAYIAVFLALALIKELVAKDDNKPINGQKLKQTLINVFVHFDSADTALKRYAKEQAAKIVEAKQKIPVISLNEVDEFALDICALVLGKEKSEVKVQIEEGYHYLLQSAPQTNLSTFADASFLASTDAPLPASGGASLDPVRLQQARIGLDAALVVMGKEQAELRARLVRVESVIFPPTITHINAPV